MLLFSPIYRHNNLSEFSVPRFLAIALDNLGDFALSARKTLNRYVVSILYINYIRIYRYVYGIDSSQK